MTFATMHDEDRSDVFLAKQGVLRTIRLDHNPSLGHPCRILPHAARISEVSDPLDRIVRRSFKRPRLSQRRYPAISSPAGTRRLARIFHQDSDFRIC